MEERHNSRFRKCTFPLEQKISSQLKRIEELLKSGDVPWMRIKSAFYMCEEAIDKDFSEKTYTYPFKYILRLTKIIFTQLFQYLQKQGTQSSSTSKIHASILGGQRSLITRFVGRISAVEDDPRKSISAITGSKIKYINGVKVSSQNAAETQLKKVMDNLESTKLALIADLIKRQSVEHNENIETSWKDSINKVIYSWKADFTQKYKQLDKKMEDNKHAYEDIIKKKDLEIARMKADVERSQISKCHFGTQTINFNKTTEFVIKQKQRDFNIERQKLPKVTAFRQKDFVSHVQCDKQQNKLTEYRRKISELNNKLNHVKTDIKQYVEQNKEIQSALFSIFDRHQKSKTPFIPKFEIQQIYEKMKKITVRQNPLVELRDQDSPRSKESNRLVTSHYKKQTNKLTSIYRPLVDVSQSISKVSSLHLASKLSVTSPINNKTPSKINYHNNELYQSPLIRSTESVIRQHSKPSTVPKALNKQNEIVLKYSQHYLTAPNKSVLKQGSPTCESNTDLGVEQQHTSLRVSYYKTQGKQISPNNNGRQIVNSMYLPTSDNQGQSSQQHTQCDLRSTSHHSIPKSTPIYKSQDKPNTRTNVSQKQQHRNQQSISKTYSAQPQDGEVNYGYNLNCLDGMMKTPQVVNQFSALMDTSNSDSLCISHNTSFVDKYSCEDSRNVETSKQNKGTKSRKDINQRNNGKSSQDSKESKDIQKTCKKDDKQNNQISNDKYQKIGKLQKSIKQFVSRYLGREGDNFQSSQFLNQIQSIKQAHLKVCSKNVCSHLCEFYEQLRKAKQYKSKVYDIFQLDNGHGQNITSITKHKQ